METQWQQQVQYGYNDCRFKLSYQQKYEASLKDICVEENKEYDNYSKQDTNILNSLKENDFKVKIIGMHLFP